ncbi:DUF3147 family protein [Cytobacillus sp. FSL R5-0569]|uniref:DUF3147 family protein n=1 Tax=Cytobacillus TaxID=2675230 RepID=UPI0027D7C549|nr:DUF3147 family protein [Cytobacillus kochii]
MQLIVKILLSAIIIGVVTEMAKRFPTYGGVIAALPLVSLLSLIWLWVEKNDTGVMSEFTLGVLLGLPSTIVLLAIVFFSLKSAFPFAVSILFGVIGWAVFLGAQFVLLNLWKNIN